MTQTTATTSTLPLKPVYIESDVKCSKCGEILGQLVHDNGRTLLSVGGLRVVSLAGQCCECRTPFYWTASRRAEERLRKHYPEWT